MWVKKSPDDSSTCPSVLLTFGSSQHCPQSCWSRDKLPILLNSWPVEPKSIINDGFLPLALGWLESNDYNRVSTRAGKAKAFSLTHTCTCEVMVRVRTRAMHSQNLPLLYVNLKPSLICFTLHSKVFHSQSCIMICPLTKHYCDVMTCTRKAWSCPVDPLQAFWQDACKWIETPPGWHEPGPDMDT